MNTLKRKISCLLILALLAQAPAQAALKFNGTSQSASTANNVTCGVNVITVCFSLYWDTNGSDDKEAVELTTNYNNNDHAFLIDPNDSSGKFAAGIQDGLTNNKYRVEDCTQPTQATWHDVAVVFDNSTSTGDIKIYLDGTAQTTTIVTNTKNQSGNFVVDKIYFMARANASAWGAGRMRDFAIYTLELTATEIAAIHNAGMKYFNMQIEPASLLMYLPMDETYEAASASGASSIIDRTKAGGNHATPTGSPLGVAENKFSYS